MSLAKQKALREQGPKVGQGTSNYTGDFRLIRQHVKGISAFEHLRDEWIEANPQHTELELLIACASFAKASGLILRENLLQSQIGGHHE